MAAPTAAQITTPLRVWQHKNSPSVPTLSGKAGATAITVGMPLIQSSGLLVPATGDNTDDTEVVGLAQSASTASGTVITYVPFWTGILFVAQLCSLGSESTVPTTPADANRFESYGLGVSQTGSKYFLDLDNTTDALFCVVDILDVATVRGRVICTPNSATTVWGA